MEVVWNNDDYRIEKTKEKTFALINAEYGTEIRRDRSLNLLLRWLELEKEFEPITGKKALLIAKEIVSLSSGKFELRLWEDIARTWLVMQDETIIFSRQNNLEKIIKWARGFFAVAVAA
ncbi:MAG: hypothetical protein ACRC8K_18395 [Waterburya sp.]